MRTPYGVELSDHCLTCGYRRNGFFCQLSPSELKDLDAVKSVSAHPAGALLFFEQQRPRGVYLLCEGQVKLSFSSKEGKTLVLRIAQAGEVLGLFSALSGSPYEVTAETVRPSQVAFVSSRDFQRFLGKHPAAFLRVASHLGLEYKTACEQLRTIGLGASISERVAKFLLTWSADKGASQNGIRFELPLSHERIAEYLGTTRESVTRALREFKSRGLIEDLGTTLLIPNRKALQEVPSCLVHPQRLEPYLVRPAPFRQFAPGIRPFAAKRAAGKRKSA